MQPVDCFSNQYSLGIEYTLNVETMLRQSSFSFPLPCLFSKLSSSQINTSRRTRRLRFGKVDKMVYELFHYFKVIWNDIMNAMPREHVFVLEYPHFPNVTGNRL